MGLFGFGKRKEEKPACCCDSTVQPEVVAGTCCGEPVKGICCVKILGAGCKSCHEQLEYAEVAVKNLCLPLEVEYVTDMEKIMNYGVMSMPAIVVNEKAVSAGKVLKTADVEKLLKNYGG